jgi:hypothetical protein
VALAGFFFFFFFVFTPLGSSPFDAVFAPTSAPIYGSF